MTPPPQQIKEPLMAETPRVSDSSLREIDLALAAMADLKPLVEYGVPGTYDSVQARRKTALLRAEGALLFLRRELNIAASEVEAARASPADTRSERERFEAWYRERYDNKLYCCNRWDGWQARASLPAPTDAEWMKKFDCLLERHEEFVMEHGNVCENNARASLLAHLRARPAEPTPSVLRQCLEVMEISRDAFEAWGNSTRKLDAAIDAARQALEKP